MVQLPDAVSAGEDEASRFGNAYGTAGAACAVVPAEHAVDGLARFSGQLEG